MWSHSFQRGKLHNRWFNIMKVLMITWSLLFTSTQTIYSKVYQSAWTLQIEYLGTKYSQGRLWHRWPIIIMPVSILAFVWLTSRHSSLMWAPLLATIKNLMQTMLSYEHFLLQRRASYHSGVTVAYSPAGKRENCGLSPSCGRLSFFLDWAYLRPSGLRPIIVPVPILAFVWVIKGVWD